MMHGIMNLKFLGLLSFKYGYENIGYMKFICYGVLYFIL